MRYYSTYAARMVILRKEGYYMSKRTATMVARKLAPLMSSTCLSADIRKIVTQLTCGQTDYFGDDRLDGFTPAELEIISRLMAWYSFEYSETGENPVFVACNLNDGFSLVISARGGKETGKFNSGTTGLKENHGVRDLFKYSARTEKTS